MTTTFVEYGYANGSANTVRLTDVTYPDGRELALDYGSAGSMADALSRVGSIIDDDNTHLADYAYLGERSFVASDLAQPDVKWTLASLTGTNDPDTGDTYTGLDRFGRVKDNRWYDYGASADADRIKYGYDRAGNRTWRQNTVADAQGKHFDELYGNDLIHRLKELARGTLNANKNGVTDKSFAECWSLDSTGNWKKFLEDTNGDGTWNLDQARTSNPVNEITGITESTGPSWATPVYSAAGNMTTVPQPADPTKTYTATYDAWNRLVKLVDDDSDDTVAEYQYDGANRRIVQKSYDEGDLQETRHLYYTQPSQWQVVEERVDAETDPDRQFVWGLRYIDDLILRDRDTNGDGSLNERLYALQDANWNLTGLVDTAGDVQERYAYSAYGTPLFLTPTFGGRVYSLFDWETLYAGYRWETLTELVHVRHRVLHSVLGMWVQRDPISKATYTSLLEYVYSIPIRGIDPFGLEWHHWFPTGDGIPELIQAICPGFDVDLFSSWVTGDVNSSGTQHHWIHKVFDYNKKVLDLLKKSLGDCCNFLRDMNEMIRNVWAQMPRPGATHFPDIRTRPYWKKYPGPQPWNEHELFEELPKKYCDDPCRQRQPRLRVPKPSSLPMWVPQNPANDIYQDLIISGVIIVVVVSGAAVITGAGAGGAGAGGAGAGGAGAGGVGAGGAAAGGGAAGTGGSAAPAVLLPAA